MRGSFAFAFFLVGVPLIAADGEWTRSAETTIDSKFMHRGIERAGASILPAIRLTDETWGFRVWGSMPFEGASRSELGASAGYTLAFDSGTKLGVEAAHFRFGGATAGQPAHATEFTVSVSFSAGPGRVAAGFTRDVGRRADIGELSYAGEYALKNWGAFLNYRFYVGAVAADDLLPELPVPGVADSYIYHGVDLTLPYRIGGQTIITAGVHYAGTNGARPFWSPNGASPGAKVWLSLAASYEF